MDKLFENNIVELAGAICSEPTYNHEVYGEKFYTCDMEIERLSGVKDIVPLTISERLFQSGEQLKGYRFRILGQLRSFNEHKDGKNRLILSVFVLDIEQLDDSQSSLNINEIIIDGYLCKEPVYRKTPSDREIADILLAVNRSYGKSDYIPCIAWGRNAKYVSNFNVSTHIKVHGRIQSREYTKRLSETESETRVAYEVSVSKIEVEEE